MVKDVDDVEIVVAPPFTALHAVAEAARNSNIGVSRRRTCYWEREGAFTGEVSAGDDAGGRRRVRDHRPLRAAAAVRRDRRRPSTARLVAALGAGLTPIVCIGETLEEREAQRDARRCSTGRSRTGLDGLTGEQVGALVIAYEPVWAIGTGRNATPAQARRGARAHPRSGCGSGSAATPPTSATSSTAAASSRTTSAS